MREVTREAVRLCRTPLLAACASARLAARTVSTAVFESPLATAARAFFTAVRTELVMPRFLVVRSMRCRFRFSADA